MEVERIARGIFESNVYVVRDGSRAIVIDVGADVSDITCVIDKYGVEVEYIILTHGHVDHIVCANELREITGAKVVAHREEEALLNNSEYNLSRSVCGRDIVVVPDMWVDESDSIEFAGIHIEFVHTPGHTSGSMCIRVGNKLFTGDMLFCGSVGRTDFPTGSKLCLEKSIKRLEKLEDCIKVYPGHGATTTIGYERKHNIWWS